MQRDGVSKLGSILLIFIVVVIAIAGIIWAGRMIFGGGKSAIETSDPGDSALLNVTANSGVRMTVRGRIDADETHRSYQITVRPNSRNMTTYQGYLGTVLRSENLANNTNAYTEFSFALDRAGMMNSRPLTDRANDVRGICATGNLYQFEVLDGDNVVKELWTTSCEAAKGSLNARSSSLRRLFTDQIPDSSNLINEAGM